MFYHVIAFIRFFIYCFINNYKRLYNYLIKMYHVNTNMIFSFIRSSIDFSILLIWENILTLGIIV